MRILTRVFGDLMADSHIIPELRTTRNAENPMIFCTLTDLTEDQDFSRDDRAISRPPRILEERRRGTFIRKPRDLKHIPNHEAETGKEFRLGMGLPKAFSPAYDAADSAASHPSGARQRKCITMSTLTIAS
jgi:hypothetical protein